MTSGAIDGGVGFKRNRHRFYIRLAANDDQCPRCFCLRLSPRCSKRASVSSARRWLLARTDSRFIIEKRELRPFASTELQDFLIARLRAEDDASGAVPSIPDLLRQPDPKLAVMEYGQNG